MKREPFAVCADIFWKAWAFCGLHLGGANLFLVAQIFNILLDARTFSCCADILLDAQTFSYCADILPFLWSANFFGCCMLYNPQLTLAILLLSAEAWGLTHCDPDINESIGCTKSRSLSTVVVLDLPSRRLMKTFGGFFPTAASLWPQWTLS